MLNMLNGLYYRDGVEISEDNYRAACTDIREKVNLARLLHEGACSIEDVPAAWQDDVLRLAEERRRAEEEAEGYEATAEDYQAALEEMGCSFDD